MNNLRIYCLKCGALATEDTMHTKEPVCGAHRQDAGRVFDRIEWANAITFIAQNPPPEGPAPLAPPGA